MSIEIGEGVEKVTLVNPNERHFNTDRYVLAFGAYGWTRLMVWATSLEDALDEAVDWIAGNAPGLLADDAVSEAYREAIAAGHDDETAQEIATEDTTCAGNNGHYLNSWEWHIVAENPTRAEVLSLLGR